MTDREALLAGILAHPEADLPRLVYADWLDDQSSTVPCQACAPESQPITPILMDYTGRLFAGVAGDQLAVKPVCVECYGRRFLPSGAQEHAKFIRDQIAGNVATMPKSIIKEFSKLIPGVATTSPTDGQMWLSGEETQLYFRRGFVAEVHAPLVWLVGGLCGNCGGTGLVDTERYEQAAPCPYCGGVYESVSDPTDRGYSPGTGRTPGHLREIVKTQPVEFVMVSDREPWEPLVAYYGANFIWVSDQRINRSQGDPWEIPDDLIRLMGGIATPTGYAFRTRADAERALSDALLTWAKRQQTHV